MKTSPFRDFIIGSVVGFAIAGALFAFHPGAAAAAADQTQCADKDATIEQQRSTIEQQQKQIASDDESKSAAQDMIGFLQEALKKGREQLAQAKAAAELPAQSGPVMTEEQCRAWAGSVNAPQNEPQVSNVSTVLYESGRPSLNISLLPLPGAPRVSVGQNSQLMPRWIIAGRIQPQMVGETRKAIYYWYNAQSSQWQGPFAPQRVIQ